MLPFALPCDVKKKKNKKNKVVIDITFLSTNNSSLPKICCENIVDIAFFKCNYSSFHDLSETYDL